MPDTTLPRPIEPGEIRVGDRVRIAWTKYDAEHTAEFTVGSNSSVDGVRTAGDGPYQTFTWSPGAWTLLDRPTPAPAVGSRWDLDKTAQYVRTDEDSYLLYAGSGVREIRDDNLLYAHLIPRLTPIPDHGDGCSPWLWDKDTGTAWVKALYDVGQTHVQVQGHIRQAGYLSDVDRDREFARRLVPWSERGQA